MRQEDEESDDEDETWHNTQYVAAMVCQPTEEQPQWGWLCCWSLLQTTKQSDDVCQSDEQLLQPQLGVHRR